MDEIKYRAWDLIEKKMHDVRVLKWTKDIGLVVWYPLGDKNLTMSQLYPGEYELLQFTGLKDRNGLEIYKGNVLKQTLPDGKELLSLVQWDDELACYRCKPVPDTDRQFYPSFGVGTMKTLEVIGNIYENPELLKEE